MATPAVTPTESAPVQAEAVQSFEIPTGEARAEWLKTGELPKPKAESAPAKETKESSEAKPETAEAETSSASEAEKSQEYRRSNAETRKQQLNAEIRELLKQRDDLKRETQAKPAETKAESAPAKPEVDPNAPKKPNPADYKDWEALEAAKDKYYEDLADYKATKAVQKADAEREIREQKAKLQHNLEEVAKRYPDWDIVGAPVLAELSDPAKSHPAVQAMLNSSPDILLDMLYVLGGDPDDLAKFMSDAKSNPIDAIERVVLVKQLVKEQLSGKKAETPRDETGKFTPAKKVTSAPPPPTDLGGTNSPPADEVEEAHKKDDFRAFRDAANRRDLARRKG